MKETKGHYTKDKNQQLEEDPRRGKWKLWLQDANEGHY